MSRKTVLLSRLACGLVFLFGALSALDARAGLSFSPPSVTGTIHYSPASPILSITSPTAAAVNTANQTLVGSLSTAGNLSINGVNVPLGPDHSFSYPVTLMQGANTFVLLGVDLGGNRVTVTKTITLDTTPPDAPNIGLISIIPPTNGVVTVTGAAGSVDPTTQITILDVTTGASVTVTSDATGAFSTTLTAQAGDQITITATDEAGNTSSAGDHVPYTAPTITVTSPSGSITNQSNLTIMGSLSEAATLTINGTGVTVNPDLSFSYPVTLNQGQNTFTLVATDPEGDNGSAVVTITLDTTAPTVPNTALISASTVTNGHTTVTGAAGSVDPDTRLTITDQTTSGTSITLTSSATGAFTATIAANPSDVLMIVATDAVGNTSAAAIQVPNPINLPPPPVITVTTQPGTYIRQPIFTITGYLSEPATLYIGQTQIPVNPDLSFSYTATNLAEGENSFNFYAYNTAHVESNEPAGTDVIFDDIPPNILITNPGPYTGQTNVTITGNLSEPATLTINGVAVSATQSGFGFSYPVTLTDGENDFTFIATDPAGNVTTLGFAVILNSGQPTIQVTSDLIVNQADYVLAGHLSKEGSFSINGTPVTYDHDLNFSYSVMLADGDNTFTLATTDLEGNNLSVNVTITLNTTPPSLTITSPLSAYTNQPNITITGILNQPGYLSDANGNGNSIPVDQDDWSFSYPMALQEGLNTFTFQVEDEAGNIAQVPWSIILDTIPPAINVPLISAVDANDGSGQATLTGLAGSIFDAGGGNVSNLAVTSVSSGQSVPASSDTTGAFSATLLGSAEDPFNITATDEVGNTDSVRVQFGTTCYAGDSAVNTTLTVVAGSGTITGPTGSAMLFPVTRTGELGFDTYVDYQTQGATAVAGQEYTGSFKIPAGAASANLSVPLLGSSINAPDANFTLKILGVHNFIQSPAVLGRQPYAVGNDPWVVIAADINGDGKPDLITVNNGDNTVSVLLNTTSGGAAQATFAAQQTFAVGSGPSSVVAVDLNKDGKLDLVVTNSVDDTITILMNTTPTGSSTVSFAAPQTIQTGNDPYYVAAADFNGDGKQDIVVLDGDPDDNVLVYLNNTAVGAPSASFGNAQVFPVGASPSYVIAADINGDLLPDIITANTGDGTISVLLNTTSNGAASASFAAQQLYPVDSPVGMAVADINGDGVPDLLVTNQTDSTVTVMTNTTPQGGANPTFNAQVFDTEAQPSSVAVANMYGDVNPALVVGNVGDNTVSVLRNITPTGATTASFAAQTVYPTGVTPWPVITADLNGDGKPDIVSADQSDSTVSVLMNGTGTIFGSCVAPASVTGTVQYNVVPPVITITSPSGTSFQSPNQTLSGSVSESVTSLTINGVTLTQNPDNTFSENIRLQPGTNTYAIVATDASGNVTPLNLVLTLNAPSLPTPAATLIQFQLGAIGSGQVTIVGLPGAAPPGDTVTVLDITDGQSGSSTVYANGGFSVTLTGSLSDEFSVSFSDNSGDQSPPVYANGNDPSLSFLVTSPTPGASVAGSMVNVTGTYAGPLDIGITVNGQLATLANGYFYVNNVSLALGSNTLTVVATTLGGLSVSQTLSVDSSGASPLILTAQSGDVGVSSLNVGFSYTYTGSAALQTLEMDYLGTGFNVVASGSQIPAYAVTYDYTAPGAYPASIRLTDVNGVQYVATVYIVVQDPTQMDALFTSIWGDMTTALSQGSEQAALNVLDYTAQQKYGPVFDALLPGMSTIVASFSPLLQSSFTPTSAEYAIVRTQGGIKQLYLVYFIQGSDGVWRLDGM